MLKLSSFAVPPMPIASDTTASGAGRFDHDRRWGGVEDDVSLDDGKVRRLIGCRQTERVVSVRQRLQIPCGKRRVFRHAGAAGQRDEDARRIPEADLEVVPVEVRFFHASRHGKWHTGGQTRDERAFNRRGQRQRRRSAVDLEHKVELGGVARLVAGGGAEAVASVSERAQRREDAGSRQCVFSDARECSGRRSDLDLETLEMIVGDASVDRARKR